MDEMTFGRTIIKSDVTVSEPATVEEVTLFIGISFNDHDTQIQRLISECRSELERIKEVTLITERVVNVAWQSFYLDERLPYCPIKTGTSITVTDLDGVTIDSTLYKIINMGGFITFKGDFPEGVKLSYTTQSAGVANIKDGFIRAVADVFENQTSTTQALLKQFRQTTFY